MKKGLAGVLTFIIAFIALAVWVGAVDHFQGFLHYELEDLLEGADAGPAVGNFEVAHVGSMHFQAVGAPDGWLRDLAGEGGLDVTLSRLTSETGQIGERAVDIAGSGGTVRYLQNSASLCDGYAMTLFWSAKQQQGSAIVKDFTGPVFCAVLYEYPDGSCRLTGFIDGDGTDFWTLPPPEDAYYFFAGLQPGNAIKAVKAGRPQMKSRRADQAYPEGSPPSVSLPCEKISRSSFRFWVGRL